MKALAGWLAGFAFALRATSGGQATQHGTATTLFWYAGVPSC